MEKPPPSTPPTPITERSARVTIRALTTSAFGADLSPMSSPAVSLRTAEESSPSVPESASSTASDTSPRTAIKQLIGTEPQRRSVSPKASASSVTDGSSSSPVMRPTKVRSQQSMRAVLYGVNHSPWTQACALALHLKGVPFRSVSLPPPSMWLLRGLSMPVVWLNGHTLRGSSEIMRGLDAVVPEPPLCIDSEAEAQWRDRAEQLFFAYVPGRMCDGARHFVYQWSLISACAQPEGDSSCGTLSLVHSCVQAAVRALPSLYFCALLAYGRLALGRGVDHALLQSNLDEWEAMLQAMGSSSAHLSGTCNPCDADLILFGHVQCMATAVGTTGQALEQLRARPRLLRWARALTARFGGSGYAWLYSSSLMADGPISTMDEANEAGGCCSAIEQMPWLRRASKAERLCFWLGLWVMTCLLLPFTLIVLGHALVVRAFNRHASLCAYSREFQGPTAILGVVGSVARGTYAAILPKGILTGIKTRLRCCWPWDVESDSVSPKQPIPTNVPLQSERMSEPHLRQRQQAKHM